MYINAELFSAYDMAQKSANFPNDEKKVQKVKYLVVIRLSSIRKTIKKV